MATHAQNIDNLENAVLGAEVRRSMIELFNEDYTLVKKAVGIGTAISTPTSSTEGYSEGNLYINNQTMDIWQMDGYGWHTVGNLKSISEVNVNESSADNGNNVITIEFTDGSSKTFNIKNGSKGTTGYYVTGAVDNGDGTFYMTLSNGSRTSNVATIRGLKGEKGDQGLKGDTGEKGRDVTSILMSGIGKQHPVTATYSDGTQQVIGIINDGNDGAGTGDMLKATYDKNDLGIVDMAQALSDGVTTIPMETVANKADKAETLSGYGITNAYTKTEVDEKLDNLASDWESIDDKPFETLGTDFSVSNNALKLSDTVNNKLSVSLIGDKYNSSYEYSKDDLCIEGNIVYRSLVDHNIGNAVTNTNYFTPTTLGNEFGTLKNTLNNFTPLVPITLSNYVVCGAIVDVNTIAIIFGLTKIPNSISFTKIEFLNNSTWINITDDSLTGRVVYGNMIEIYATKPLTSINASLTQGRAILLRLNGNVTY